MTDTVFFFRTPIMFMFSTIETLASPERLSKPIPPRAAPDAGSKDPLSFLVDLGDLGMEAAYQAREVHRGSQCLIYARVGPEYVNPRSGKSEQASWIL